MVSAWACKLKRSGILKRRLLGLTQREVGGFAFEDDSAISVHCASISCIVNA